MLVCFTSSHRTTDFGTLERLERASGTIADALAAHPLPQGSLVLATCNRFEAYVDVPGTGVAGADAAHRTLRDTVAAVSGIPVDDVADAGDVLHGADVARHVFAVASGLESVVVGEGEIAGQVRRALADARRDGTASRDLERVFQQASRVSRGVKNRTGLSGAGRSVVRLALDLAEARVADWRRARVLLVGTGRYAAATLAAVRERGATDVHVHSRSGRAETFARGHDVAAVPDDGLVDALASSDVVIACTVAPAVVIDAAMVADAATRPGAVARRLVIDLGLPRNVASEVAAVPGTDLLDLETIGTHADLPELGAAADARALVAQALADYRARAAEDAAVPAVVALRDHVYRVLDDELAWAARRGRAGDEVTAALRHFAGVLLHAPTVRGRELARAGEAERYADAVQTLFGTGLARTCPHAAPERP